MTDHSDLVRETQPLRRNGDLQLKLANIQIKPDNNAGVVTFSLRQGVDESEVLELPVEVDRINDMLDQAVHSAKLTVLKSFEALCAEIRSEADEQERRLRRT